MSFRLVPKLVTLNDLERRNGPLYCVILPNSVVSGAHCVSVRVRCRCKKFTFAISYPQFLVLLVAEVVTGASHPCIRMEYVWSLYRVITRRKGPNLGVSRPRGGWILGRVQLTVFSERERSLYAVAGPSLCRLSVCKAEVYFHTKASSSTQPFGHKFGQKLGGGSWVPIEHKVAWAEAYLHTKWHLSPSSPLATTDIRQKLGVCIPSGEGELGPHLTHCRVGQSLSPCEVPS